MKAIIEFERDCIKVCVGGPMPWDERVITIKGPVWLTERIPGPFQGNDFYDVERAQTSLPTEMRAWLEGGKVP